MELLLEQQLIGDEGFSANEHRHHDYRRNMYVPTFDPRDYTNIICFTSKEAQLEAKD